MKQNNVIKLACFLFVLSKSKWFPVRPFLVQTGDSYRKIPPIKHVHFIISILKAYYFKQTFGRIRNMME